MHARVMLRSYCTSGTCPSCKGGSYHPETVNYKIWGAHAPSRAVSGASPETLLTLPQFQALSISDARDLLRKIDIPAGDKTVQMLRNEISARLNYICEVGVSYLAFDRSTRTLISA